MIYAATAVWMTIIVLMAWAVHHLWCSIAKPKAVNWVLLPGTLVAQIGRTVGLLITGAKINNTALMDSDDNGDPATDPHYESSVPVFGPVIVGFLPLLAMGIVIYIVLIRLGMPVVTAASNSELSPELPVTLAGVWDQLRALITLAECTLNAVLNAEMVTWKLVLFTYLMICMTVRMAPLRGNARGHLGAIAAIGIITALVGTVTVQPVGMIQQAWPLISLTVGWLLILMMISLLARGVVSTIQVIAKWG